MLAEPPLRARELAHAATVHDVTCHDQQIRVDRATRAQIANISRECVQHEILLARLLREVDVGDMNDCDQVLFETCRGDAPRLHPHLVASEGEQRAVGRRAMTGDGCRRLDGMGDPREHFVRMAAV